jgi:U6 snRNA phosphodiesterase
MRTGHQWTNQPRKKGFLVLIPVQPSLTLCLRKLPSLPASFVPAVPRDDASLHQGRTRTTPHRDGQFAAHVYIALVIERHSPLCDLIHDILGHARRSVSTLHAVGLCDVAGHELHISLSRAIYLRAHQREDLKRAVKAVAACYPPCVDLLSQCLALP